MRHNKLPTCGCRRGELESRARERSAFIPSRTSAIPYVNGSPVRGSAGAASSTARLRAELSESSCAAP